MANVLLMWNLHCNRTNFFFFKQTFRHFNNYSIIKLSPKYFFKVLLPWLYRRVKELQNSLMTCLRPYSKHFIKVEKWWFKESKTFIIFFFFPSCSQPGKQLLSGLQRLILWRMLISIPEHWKLPVTASKKGLQPGKEKKGRISSIELIFLRLTGKFVGLKSTLTELQHWMYFSWCDSTAAKSQLQLGNCRAGCFIIFIHAGTPAVAVAGCSWSAISSQLLSSSKVVTAIVCKR